MAEVDSGKRYNRVLEIIEKRLIPDEEAKKARGEVFTPLNLVREMLFGLRRSVLEKLKGDLPDIKSNEYHKLIWGIDADGMFIDDDEKDKVGGIPVEVFRDSKTKWLDPANGIGNFPVVAFYMLDYQLGKHGNDDKLKGDENATKRKEHIIKNMLYMIELNKGNINASKKIFSLISPGIEPNIICANTLEMSDDKLIKELGSDKFDVIMGNPPYNSGGVKSSGKGDEDYETIWHHFVHKSSKKFPGGLRLLKTDGYLCFIHPSSWLHINDNAKMNKVLLSHDLQFLRIYTNIQSGKMFSGGGMVRTAYYVLRQNTNGDKITILDTDNIIEDLSRSIIGKDEFSIYSNNNILINKAFQKFKAIGEVKDEKGAPYLKSNGKIKGLLSSGEFKNIVTHKQTGIEICKSSIEFIGWERAKIIIKGSSNLFHFDDYGDSLHSGKYGIYGNWGYYLTDSVENLQKFSKFFDTNIAKLIMRATKEDQDFIEPKYLPDIRKYNGEINDKKLCEYLDIDFEHIKSFDFIPNNQNIAKETNGCSPKGRKTLAAKPKKGGFVSRRLTRKIRR